MRGNTTGLVIGAILLALAGGCNSGSRSSGTSGTTAAPVSSTGTTAPTGSGTTAPPTTTPPTTSPAGPAGEDVRTYQGRRYRLFVPQVTGTSAIPLVVCFHGSGDTGLNFYATMRAAGWMTAAQAEEVMILVPDTKSPFQSFPVCSGNPNNDIPEMQVEMSEVVDLIQTDVAPQFPYDPAALHALGFSDGGLFTGAVGLERPELATTSIFGYGWGSFYIVPQTQAPRPVHMACGSTDQFFNAASTTQGFLAGQGHDVLWEPVNGVGHTFTGVSAAIAPDAALAWMKQRALGAPPPTTTPPVPGATGSGGTGGALGQSTRTVTTTAQPGLAAISIDYDVYVPANYDPATPAPLVIAANMGLVPWRGLADVEGCIVVDFRDHDRNGGFNFGYDVLGLDAIIQEVEGAWNVDRGRRYYHGFSAGAHWGYAVIFANANAFAGLGINAGSLQIATQQGIWPNNVQRKIPVAIRHGATDAVVPVAAARSDRTALDNAGHAVVLEEFQGGHTIAAADAAAVWASLSQYRAP